MIVTWPGVSPRTRARMTASITITVHCLYAMLVLRWRVVVQRRVGILRCRGWMLLAVGPALSWRCRFLYAFSTNSHPATRNTPSFLFMRSLGCGLGAMVGFTDTGLPAYWRWSCARWGAGFVTADWWFGIPCFIVRVGRWRSISKASSYYRGGRGRWRDLGVVPRV